MLKESIRLIEVGLKLSLHQCNTCILLTEFETHTVSYKGPRFPAQIYGLRVKCGGSRCEWKKQGSKTYCKDQDYMGNIAGYKLKENISIQINCCIQQALQ